MECSGGPVRIAVHPQLLGPFRQSFQGVVWAPECDASAVLVKFCGGAVSIHNSTVAGVQGSSCGAIISVVGSTHMVLRNSVIKGNNATALVAGMTAWLHVHNSTIADNAGWFGSGGIHAVANSTVVVDGGSVISGNMAWNSSGGGVAVGNSAVLVVSSASHIENNNSTMYSGGGIAVVHSGQVRIECESIVCNNTCVGTGGGGIALAGQAELALVGGSLVCNNTAGSGAGGLFFLDNVTVTIRNSSIIGNRAYSGSGGGFLAGDHSSVDVFDSTIANNTSIYAGEGVLGGGGLGASGSATVKLFSTSLLGNRALGLPGGAFVVNANASLTMGAGVILSGNTNVANTSTGYVQYGPDGVAGDGAKLNIEPGVLGEGGPLTKCSRSIVLNRRPCGVGEFDGGDGGSCLCCPALTYSFEPNVTTCQPCPPNALCSADIVAPVAEYWHSSPRSLQMHKCPISASCKQGGVCAAGYTGNLCGQCSDGFGITSPLRCGKCMVPRLQLGVYIVVVGVTVLLVTVTVHFTWQDNKTGDRSLRPSDLIKVLVQYLQYVVILGNISVPWPAFLTGMFTAATVVFGVGSGQALSLDCWLSYYVSSKLPLAVQRQLSYILGALVVALACVVLMIIPHVCIWVWKACIHQPTRGGSRQQAPPFHFWSRLRVTLLVTAFFAYPTLVKAALSFFACVRIDETNSEQPYPEYSIRNHTAGYWVSAIQQECFAGWHRSWALGFGFPAVVILCFGVPVWLWLFLWINKLKTPNAAFREHYGFLFRNYTDSKPWWEAVWAVQIVLLTAISVFHFTLQAYYALLLMALILLLSIGAQVVARPYAQPLLHKLHLASTCCLFLLVWLSLALFSAPVEVDRVTLGRAHTALAVVMVVLACSFVLWCVGTIVRVASPVLMACAARSITWVQDCAGGIGSCHQPIAHKSLGRYSGSQQQVSGPVIEQAVIEV